MRPKRTATTLILAGVLALAPCTPDDVQQIGRDWYGVDVPPEVAATLADAWNAGDQDPHTSGDCYVEMRHHFPEWAWARMSKIIHRESRGNPWAQNPTSSAFGCWQLLAMHDHRYDRGCPKSAGAHCQAIAARRLFDAAGWSPWRLTA